MASISVDSEPTLVPMNTLEVGEYGIIATNEPYFGGHVVVAVDIEEDGEIIYVDMTDCVGHFCNDCDLDVRKLDHGQKITIKV